MERHDAQFWLGVVSQPDKITVNTAVLEADSAVFIFDGKQLTHAELQGNPASFTEVEPSRQKPVRGGARTDH